MVRVQRVKSGKGRFCSLKCANVWQAETSVSSKIGKENAKTYPKQSGGYFVQWVDAELGKPINSPWHKWAWEMNFGEIPSGYVVEYVDGNKNNIALENLQLRLTRRGKNFLPKKKKVLSVEHRAKISKAVKLRWESGEFDGKIFKDISGDKNPCWRGGVSNRYPQEFYDIRDFVINRDYGQCQICGREPKSPHVHHRDGNVNHNDQNNLLTLCSNCHSRVHKKNTQSPPIMALRAELHWNR